MPTYTVRDPRSNRTIKVTGDSPPTEAELHQIFARLNADGAPRETPLPSGATSGMVPQNTITDQPRAPVAGRGTQLDVRKSGEFAQGIGSSVPFTDIDMPHTAPGVIGRATGEAAQWAYPMAKGGAAIKAMLPNQTRAAQAFQAVMGATKSAPVNISEPGNAALRVMELAERGGSMPKVARDFLRRVTDPEKASLTYEEARDFYHNLSRLSADEFNRLTPVMKRAIGDMRAALNSAIEGTVEQTGQLQRYRGAMKEYARAARLREATERLGRTALKWGGGATIGALAYDKLSDLIRGR